MSKFLIVTIALLASLFVAVPAGADTPGCVSISEYNNTERYLSTQQIAGRYDTNGVYRSSDSDEFSRSYDACWSSSRVVVWYSLNLGWSTRWDVR